LGGADSEGGSDFSMFNIAQWDAFSIYGLSTAEDE
jgi:hypothetical protein